MAKDRDESCAEARTLHQIIATHLHVVCIDNESATEGTKHLSDDVKMNCEAGRGSASTPCALLSPRLPLRQGNPRKRARETVSAGLR